VERASRSKRVTSTTSPELSERSKRASSGRSGLKRAMIAVRIAEAAGRSCFFPGCAASGAGAADRGNDHAHTAMPMQTAPESPFEVIEAKFLLELLMGLLAEPAP
jgi:hypothetical protein